MKVVETEKPSWKPSPAPTPSPISLQRARKTGRGTKVQRVAGNSRLSNGIKSAGRRAVRRSRSELRLCKQKIRENLKAFISMQPTRVSESARAAGD